MYNRNFYLPAPDTDTIQQLNHTKSFDTNNEIDTRTHNFLYFRKTACTSLISLPIAFVLFQGFMIFLFGLTVEQSVQISKLYENEICCDKTDCLSPMNCSTNNVCECNSYEYHNTKLLKCLPQNTNQESCSKTSNRVFKRNI